MQRSRMVLALIFGAAFVMLESGFPVTAHAQKLTPGTRIRITAGDARTIGYLERSRPDSLLLALPDGGQAALSWAEVEHFEMSLGMRGRAGRGALIGAGLMTAFFVSMAWGYDTEVLFPGLPVSTAFGAGLGALAGNGWRSERWHRIPAGTASVKTWFSPGLTVVARF